MKKNNAKKNKTRQTTKKRKNIASKHQKKKIECLKYFVLSRTKSMIKDFVNDHKT